MKSKIKVLSKLSVSIYGGLIRKNRQRARGQMEDDDAACHFNCIQSVS